MACLSTKRQKSDIVSISTLLIGASFPDELSSIEVSVDSVSIITEKYQISLSDIKRTIKSVTTLKLSQYDVVILNHCDQLIDRLLPIIREKNTKLFIIIYSINANESAIFRETCFKLSCNMVTIDPISISKVYDVIATAKYNHVQYANDKSMTFYQCPYPQCGVTNLTEDDLWRHCPLYHIGTPNAQRIDCPICHQQCGRNGKPFQVHLRNEHGLCANHIIESEYKGGVPSYVFSLVVVRRKSDGKFLLVQEFASCGFWLPGGRVDPGETTESAALRECEEEAGVKITLKGIIKIEFRAYRFEDKHKEHRAENDYCRMRVIYYAEPDIEDDDESKQSEDENETGSGLLAKSIPDYESMGACWVTPDELDKITLRGYEPSQWIPYVVRGDTIYPLELMECEKHVKSLRR